MAAPRAEEDWCVGYYWPVDETGNIRAGEGVPLIVKPGKDLVSGFVPRTGTLPTGAVLQPEARSAFYQGL